MLRISVENNTNQRWALARLIGDSRAYPDQPGGGRNWARYTNRVYNGFRHCSWLASILGYWGTAITCVKIAIGMNGVDSFWRNMTTGGQDGSDAIVQNASQVYPSATKRYIINGADSHLGETASDKVKDQVKSSLLIDFGAQTHP